MNANSRNLAIDWIKGVMIIAIVLVHSGTISCLHHAYLGVEVFFFFSGFFLMQSFTKKPTTSVLYVWSRVKRFYLPYILCFIFACILRYEGLTHFPDFDSFLEKYAQFTFCLTLTEEIGPTILHEHYLWGSWFLSVLMIDSYILYSMLSYNQKLSIEVVFPLICILGFTFIFTQNESIMNWSRIGAISMPLLRGLCEMAAGAFIYDVWSRHKAAFEKRSTLINIAATLSFILFIALMFSRKPLDKYLIATIPWLLLGSVIDKSWLNLALHRNHGLLTLAGRNSIYILFAHPSAILLVHWTNTNLLNDFFSNQILLALDIALSLIATVVLYYTCIFIRTRKKRS